MNIKAMKQNPFGSIIGYWTALGGDTPTVSLPNDAPCVFCWQPITDENTMRTSTIWQPAGFCDGCAGTKAYFYRMHRLCDDNATEEQKKAAFDDMVGLIKGDSLLETDFQTT